MGWELVSQARERGNKTARERAYIEATAAYYQDALNRAEGARLASFAAGWQQVYAQFPEDREGALFFSLAHIATAPADDTTYQHQKEAGAIAEQVLAAMPDHPGAHHYIIHAYDVPTLGESALEVARNYGKVAPDVPHATHMPAHIFVRLGLWQELMAKQVLGFLNKGAIISRTSIAGSDISVLELHVESGAPITEHELANLQLPSQCLIAAVSREDYVRVPGADDRLRAGDTVVALADRAAETKMLPLFDGPA